MCLSFAPGEADLCPFLVHVPFFLLSPSLLGLWVISPGSTGAPVFFLLTRGAFPFPPPLSHLPFVKPPQRARGGPPNMQCTVFSFPPPSTAGIFPVRELSGFAWSLDYILYSPPRRSSLFRSPPSDKICQCPAIGSCFPHLLKTQMWDCKLAVPVSFPHTFHVPLWRPPFLRLIQFTFPFSPHGVPHD